MFKKLLLTFGVLIVLFAGLRLFLPIKNSDGVRLEQGDIVSVLKERGVVESQIQKNIYSRYSGILSELYIKEGEVVSKNQLLFSLDSLELSHEIKQKSIQLDQLTSKIRSLKGALRTKKRLASKHIISEAEIKEINKQLHHQLLEKTSLDDRLSFLLNKEDYFLLKSPDDGLLSRLDVQKGQRLSPGQLLGVVIHPGKLQIVLFIQEYEAHVIKLNQDVDIRFLSSTNRHLKGKVRQIIPVIQDYKQGIGMKVIVEPLGKISADMLPGMQVDIDIKTTHKERCLYLPVDYVAHDEIGTFVYLQGNQKRYIKTGVSNHTRIEVLEGLSSQEKVVKYR